MRKNENLIQSDNTLSQDVKQRSSAPERNPSMALNDYNLFFSSIFFYKSFWNIDRREWAWSWLYLKGCFFLSKTWRNITKRGSYSTKSFQEQKVQLQTQVKDSHLNQLGEVEKRFRTISRQCAVVRQVHEKLEQNGRPDEKQDITLKCSLNGNFHCILLQSACEFFSLIQSSVDEFSVTAWHVCSVSKYEAVY